MVTDTDNTANNNTDGQGTQNNQSTQPAADGQGAQNGQQQNGQPAPDNKPAADGQTKQGGTTQQDAPKGTLLGGNDKPAAPSGAPDQYDYTAAIPEGMQVDQQLADGFSVIAREMNLTNDQANKIAAYGIQYGQQVAQKQVPGIRKALNETGAGNRIEVIKVMRLMGELVQSDPGKLANLGGAAKPENESWYNNSKMKF